MSKKFNQEMFASILVIFVLHFPTSSFSSDPTISDQSKTYECPYYPACLPPPIPVNCPPPPPLPPVPPLPPGPPSPPLTPPLPPVPPLAPPFPFPPFPPRPPYAPPPPNPILPYFPWYYKNPPPPPVLALAMRVEVFSNLLMAPCMVFLALFSFFY